MESRIIEESNDCSRARIFAQVSAEATAAGEGSAHRHQMAESPVAQQQHHENPNTATSVSQVNLGTTRAGRVRQRIQWTTEMNEYVLRCYYISTNCEEPEHMTTYRERMLDLFLRRYRHLNGKLTENSLATRKKAIFQHEYVKKEKQEEIKSAIHNELRRVERREEEIIPDITEARNPQPENLAEFTNLRPEINLIYESTERDSPETNEEREVKDTFNNYLANYEGMDPLQRPRIPRLGESEKLNEVVKTLNSKILPAYVANSTNLEYVNTLIYVSALTTVRLLGKHPKVQTFKNTTTQKTPVVPKWQRRLQTRIAGLRESLGRLTSFKNGARSKRLGRHISKIITPLKPQTVEIDQLSEIIDRKVQQLAAYSKRLRRYLKSNQRRRENQLFHKNQKSFYRNLEQKSNAESQTSYPQKPDIEQFWEKIWAQAEHFNADANWLAKEKEKSDNVAPMHFCDITAEEIKISICTTANWKSPGLDQLHNIWLKKLPVMHEALARCYNELLKNTAVIPEFLTAGVTYLLPKDTPSVDPAKYRPITCLSTTYKLLTKIIANRIYEHCEINGILCEEQKGCRKRTMGCKDQLIIDTVITGVALRRRRNLSVAFIDYKKAFDSMPHDYLLEILRIYKVDAATVALLGRIMSKWNTKLVLNGTVSKQISIKRGIFQGDALSPLWFCIGLNPLSRLLTHKQNGFTLKTETREHTFNHLLFVDDLKLYANKKHKLHELIDVTKAFSDDVGMEFGTDKCKIIHLIRGQLDETEENYAVDQNIIIDNLHSSESYKYLGFLQLKGINHTLVKQNLIKKFEARLKAILKTSLNSGNKCKAINTWAIPLLTYSFGVIKWSQTDILRIETLIRTTFTKFQSHYPQSAVERISLPRNVGGRGIINIARLHFSQTLKLRTYFLSSESHLFKAIAMADNGFTPLSLMEQDFPVPEGVKTPAEMIAAWKAKTIHGAHPHDLEMEWIDAQSSSLWLKRGKLFSETEGFAIAIQDRVIPTRNFRRSIHGEAIEDRCRRCGIYGETIDHIIAGCSVLAPREYVMRHNNIAKILHQQLAIKHGLLQAEVLYFKYEPKAILENANFKLYWDRFISTDQTAAANKPDIILFDKINKTIEVIDIAVPLNRNIQSTYSTKVSKYAALAIELKRMYKAREVNIIPIIISSTGLVPKHLIKNLKKYDCQHLLEDMQKSTILDTCAIVRRFLNI